MKKSKKEKKDKKKKKQKKEVADSSDSEVSVIPKHLISSCKILTTSQISNSQSQHV